MSGVRWCALNFTVVFGGLCAFGGDAEAQQMAPDTSIQVIVAEPSQAPVANSSVRVDTPPPPPSDDSTRLGAIQVRPSAPVGPRVVLQLESHAPSVTLYRQEGRGYVELCHTPCALQVFQGSFEFSLDQQGRDLRVVQVGPAGSQLYVDAEAAGGISAPRPDGMPVAPTNTLQTDGNARFAASWMVGIGVGVAASAGLLCAYFSVLTLGIPVGGSTRDVFTGLAVGSGVISGGGLALSAIGMSMMVSNNGRARPAPRVALLPAFNGLQLLGAF
jgi:hypothetical protein